MRKLEIIALNATDAKAAEQAGADRIELVSAMEVGGLSPTIEIIKEVLKAVTIPVNVMVRLKAESFVYNPQEFEALLEYVAKVKDLGINGVVFGSLTTEQLIDVEQLKALVSAVGNLDVTFHRAIDEYDQTYEQNFNLLDGKTTTLLTSGGTEKALVANVERIKSISNNQTRILVGGGVNKDNYQQLFDQLTNCDFHIGSLAYKDGDFTAGIDSERVSEVKAYLNKY